MKKRNGNLDLLKFLFALMIVFFHGKDLATDGHYIFAGGNIAVEFFFIVSGCLMASAASKREMNESLGHDTFAFMKHKIKGLMPNYYVAFVIAFVVMHRDAKSWISVAKDLAGSVWELLLVMNVGLRKAGGINNGPVWYLSAMLLAMFIIWPIMRKYKDTFFYVIAPILALFLLGFTYHSWQHLGGASKWVGMCMKGTVRAFIATLIGCIVYKVSEELKDIEFTKVARGLFSIVEWGGYLAIFAWSFLKGRGRYDWLELILLTVCITITMSNVGFGAKCFQSPVFNWLGVYSYSLYLGHGFWANSMVGLFPKMTYWQRMPIYLMLALGTGLVIYFVSAGLRKFWNANAGKIKAVFIAEKTVG